MPQVDMPHYQLKPPVPGWIGYLLVESLVKKVSMDSPTPASQAVAKAIDFFLQPDCKSRLFKTALTYVNTHEGVRLGSS